MSERIEHKLSSNSFFFSSTSDVGERISPGAIAAIKVSETRVAGDWKFAACEPGLGMIGST
jgi:hypothetical protein